MTLLTRGAAGCNAPGVASGTKTSGFGSQPAAASNATATRAGSGRPRPGENLIVGVSPGSSAAPDWEEHSARGRAGSRLLLAGASAGSGTAADCRPRRAAPEERRAAPPTQQVARLAPVARAAPGSDRPWAPASWFRPDRSPSPRA